MRKTLLGMGMIAGLCGAADAKTLVAYYSRSGNTAAVANVIAAARGADVYEIRTADINHYPTAYRATTEMAADEIENGTYPEIQDVPDLTAYDTVFVGTPCWWGTMAGPVHTFLTTADLSGKTVIPFNTHEGSGAGTVHTDIVGLTPDSKHARGIAIHGSDAANATDMIQTWLADIME